MRDWVNGWRLSKRMGGSLGGLLSEWFGEMSGAKLEERLGGRCGRVR